MRISQSQLRDLIRRTLKEAGPRPPQGTSLQTRAPARAAVDHPEIKEAIDVMIGAVSTALFEVLGDEDAADLMEQSLHTDFHNDLYNFVEEWMNTYTEGHAKGEFE